MIRYLKFGILMLLAGTYLQSCSGSKEIKDGRTAYNMKLYDQAAGLLQKDLAKAKDNITKKEITLMIADSYERSNQNESAEKWLEKALRINFDPDVQLRYASVLMKNEKYQEAIEAYEYYIKEEPYSNLDARRGLSTALKALEWRKSRTNLKVEALDDLNSAYSDFAPIVYKDNSIVFTSSRSEATGDAIYGWTGEKYGDLFISDKKGEFEFAKPKGFSATINTGFYEGTASFSRDFKELYFTYCPQVDEKQTAFCQIYYSKQIAGTWTDPEVVPLFQDTCNTGHPFISSDGNTLWFASNFENGFGGRDIYYALRTQDGWTQPYNAGRKINTFQDEMFPYVDDEGILYFASNGHGGMGGLDIFKARKVRNQWTDIRNMRHPINSGADDFGMVMEKLYPEDKDDPILASGYFSSTRDGGKGGDDLYKFVYENINYFVLEGRVVEKDYNDPEDPKSEVKGLKPLPKSEIVLTMIKDGKRAGIIMTDSKGRFNFKLEPNTDYKILASKTGYFNNSEIFSTKGKGTPDSLEVKVRVEIELEKIWPDLEIVIPNIYYDFNKSTLRAESFPVLDSLLTLFYENPDIKIEIGSHTDSRGSSDYNDDLSQRRAESVVNYLLENEVADGQITPIGYGERKLVNDCVDGVECTEEEHQKNRRTTFRVLGEDLDINSVEPEDVQVDPEMLEKERSNQNGESNPEENNDE